MYVYDKFEVYRTYGGDLSFRTISYNGRVVQLPEPNDWADEEENEEVLANAVYD